MAEAKLPTPPCPCSWGSQDPRKPRGFMVSHVELQAATLSVLLGFLWSLTSEDPLEAWRGW